MSDWPHDLQPATGPMPAERIDGVAAGMADAGPVTGDLIANGWLPPDVMCSMGLFILARQPRIPSEREASGPAKASNITGSVWVREQCTIHAPAHREDAFRVEGRNLARFVRRRRRYATSIAHTVASDGTRLATNITTGLTSFRPVEGLADSHVGTPADQIIHPGADHSVAANNPHVEAIAAARPGDSFEPAPVTMTLAMMIARDTAASDNPIHSDPEQARAAGLDRPIAGGNHVLSFALEPVLAAWGPQALSHGARIDTRWKAPTKADDTMTVHGQVTSVTADSVVVEVAIDLNGGVTALQSTLTVPLPR